VVMGATAAMVAMAEVATAATVAIVVGSLYTMVLGGPEDL
jgi:hypothetical protein